MEGSTPFDNLSSDVINKSEGKRRFFPTLSFLREIRCTRPSTYDATTPA